jgi:hypothetical protein
MTDRVEDFCKAHSIPYSPQEYSRNNAIELLIDRIEEHNKLQIAAMNARRDATQLRLVIDSELERIKKWATQ